MTHIVLAYCILHNFLRSVDHDPTMLDEVDRELAEEYQDGGNTQQIEDDYKHDCNLRDEITNRMWIDYENN